jgi:membrane fusion protein (multidrug efflux system)
MLATLAVRERDRERWRSLAARDLASGDRADQADTQWRAAVAEAQRLDGAHKEATAALAEASAAVTLAEVEQDAARLGLERCTLRAPFAGVVAERLVQPGQWLAAGAVALRLVSTDQVRVRVHVREEDALAVAAGATAELSLPGVHPLPAGDGSPHAEEGADGAGPFPGVVEGVAGAADARTRTFAVDVVAPGSDVLRPGLFARVVLHGALLHEAVLVPDAAVVADEAGERYFVFVVDGDRARRVAVTLGPRQGEGRLLRGGLGAQPVELVVGGTSLLFDGAPIARLPR